MIIPSSEGVQVFPVSDAPTEVNAFQKILQEMQPVEMADAVETEGMELVAPAVKTSKTTETAEVVPIEENPELEVQAAQIGEAVGKEHKVKVEVNIKAEKLPTSLIKIWYLPVRCCVKRPCRLEMLKTQTRWWMARVHWRRPPTIKMPHRLKI